MQNSKELRIDKELQALIPPLTQEELTGLESSLKADGCRDSLIVWDGIIVDGHHRYEICTRLGIDFDTRSIEFNGKDQAKMWMIDNQKGRRNLTDGWKFELAQVRKALLLQQGREKMSAEGTKGLEKRWHSKQLGLSESDRPYKEHSTQKELAKDLGWSTGKVAQADKVRREAPEIWDSVKSGATSVDKAYREVKKQKIQKQKQTRAEQYIEPELTNKSYRVIYADPPWKYNDKQEIGELGGASKHYITMTINELCEMQLPDIDDDAVLFLWTTSPLLEESFRVVNAWGFKYKSSFIWDKVKHNMGHYNSVRHEILLICTRGSCTPDVRKLFDSVQSIEKTEHSAKPHEFYEIIETLYTYGNKIELFARNTRETWDSYGNELKSR